MSDLIWILAVILILYLLQQMLISHGYVNGETFCGFGRDGKNCDKVGAANETCKQLAEANCRIPIYMKNDCWLNEYENCKQSGKCGTVGRPVSSNCNCYDLASSKCGSDTCPADACFHDLHQKCMAGLGLAPDPDRGEMFPR
jgi:hypothetical protein